MIKLQQVNIKIFKAMAHDLSLSLAAWFLAFYFRFNFAIPNEVLGSMVVLMLLSLPVSALVFWGSGIYRAIWHFASIPDLKRICMAVGLNALVMALLVLMIRIFVPRLVLVLYPLLLLIMLGGTRFAYRSWKEHRLYGLTRSQGEPVFVLGAGETAIALLKNLSKSPDWQVVGFLDDNPEMHGLYLYGVPVLGPISSLSTNAEATGVDHVIVAMPSASHEIRHRAVKIANQAGLTVLTVPSFEDIMSGKVNVSQVRPVEVEDLLGREPVNLDNAGLQFMVENKVVMVTGAGGSIGSELCRQIAKYNPRLLILFEQSEYSLYAVEQEFSQNYSDLKIVCVIGDVKNPQRVDAVFQHYQASLVFHAAAYKHVPLMENLNVGEALLNNVIGTYNVAEACKNHQVEKFVLISTDKAVNSTNVMGASKKLAEMVCQGLQESDGTRFVIVRFGNVLGSSGSVIPKFRDQIAKGGPVTVTHPEVTRYFMSIPEAAQLVMQASLMGVGGEIFVLDMGEPVKIADLAREMIRLSGVPDGQIEIIFSGLRPGEKLYEELLADSEQTLQTPHSKLRVAKALPVDPHWVRKLLQWLSVISKKDEPMIKHELKSWVEDYVGDINATSPTLTVTTTLPIAPSSSSIH